MTKIQIYAFNVIGIKVRTANDGSAGKDIPKLWAKFMDEGISDKIPNKVSEEVYCLYTNYDGDHMDPYDVILGCKVSGIEKAPEGMVAHSVKTGNGAKFVAKGSLIKGEAIVNTWFDIWKAGLDRSFATDFEVYDDRSKNLHNAEVDIYISLN